MDDFGTVTTEVKVIDFLEVNDRDTEIIHAYSLISIFFMHCPYNSFSA